MSKVTRGPDGVLLVHPFDSFVAELEERGLTRGAGCRVVPGSSQIKARCPIHQDARASLSVKRETDRVLFRCWAGCRHGEILQAFGWRSSDTFLYALGSQRPRPHVVATYDYHDVGGVLVAQKRRFSNKTFAWRRPVGDAWVSGLDAAPVSLYRLPELAGVSRLYVCEGEKAVDLLWSLGLAATCGPAGASTWLPAWSHLLAGLGVGELIVLPDADRAGAKHAERVAALTFDACGESLPVRVLPIPGLPRGADVFDWLTGEGSRAGLEIAAYWAPVWRPEAVAESREARRRHLNAERQRRFRTKRTIESPRNAENLRESPLARGCNAENLRPAPVLQFASSR